MFEKIIFIGGGPCSGTTLLNSWLKRHKDMASSDETWAVDSLCILKQNLVKQNWFNADDNIIFNEVFQNLLSKSKLSKDKKYLLHHNTRITNIIDQVFEIFPEAYYILVIRDGRRVIASMKAKWFLNKYQTTLPYYLVQSVRKWCKYADFIINNNLPSKTLLIKYNDIQSGIDKKIIDFLEISHDKIDLDTRINSNFQEIKQENYWKEYLDEKEKNLISCMNERLLKLGFEI